MALCTSGLESHENSFGRLRGGALRVNHLSHLIRDTLCLPACLQETIRYYRKGRDKELICKSKRIFFFSKEITTMNTPAASLESGLHQTPMLHPFNHGSGPLFTVAHTGAHWRCLARLRLMRSEKDSPSK